MSTADHPWAERLAAVVMISSIRIGWGSLAWFIGGAVMRTLQ
jgi:hypothetical protein